MRAHILYVTLFVLFIAVTAVFPQAATESVLLNSNSATATAKAGTSLGNALNKASNRIAGQIETVPQSKAVIHHTSKPANQSLSHPNAPTTATTSGASMITSIQGGRVTTPSAAPTSAAPAAPPHN